MKEMSATTSITMNDWRSRLRMKAIMATSPHGRERPELRKPAWPHGDAREPRQAHAPSGMSASADGPPRDGARAGRLSGRSLFAEGDAAHQRLVLRVDVQVDVALHGVGQHLIVDRQQDAVVLYHLPDLGDGRVALVQVDLGAERAD